MNALLIFLNSITAESIQITFLYEKVNIDSNLKFLISNIVDAYNHRIFQPLGVSLKVKDYEAIRKFCLAPQPNLAMKLNDSTYLIKEYDVIMVGNNPKELPYTYTLEKNGKLDTPYFELDFSMGALDRGIKD